MKSWHSHVDVGKKVLASALSAAMVVAFTPVVAMADEPAATLPGAENGVITLTEDVTLTTTPADFTSNTTLDLNGHALSTTNGFWVSGSDTTFTLKDSKTGGMLTSAGYGIGAENGAKVIVESGTIQTKYACLSGNNTYGDMNFTINGGTLTSSLSEAIYMPGQQVCEINGGTINGGISTRMGQITINGGTINGMTSTQTADSIGEYWGYSGSVWIGDAIYVLAGTYNSVNTAKGNSFNLTINGGTINGNAHSAVAVYDLAWGYDQTVNVSIGQDATISGAITHLTDEQIKSDSNTQNTSYGHDKSAIGSTTVTSSINISGGSFSDLSAVPYVIDGATIALSNNVSASAYTKIDKKMTIDLGGNTLSSTSGGFIVNKDLTVKNGTIDVAAYGAWVQSGAKFEIAKDATIKAKDYGVVVVNSGSSIVCNGTVTSTKNAGISGVGNNGDGEVNITVGPKASVTCTDEEGAGIYFPNTAALNIKGKVSGATGIYAKSGTTTIYEGALVIGTRGKTDYAYSGNGFNPTGDAIVIDSCNYPGGLPTLIVSGGTIKSTNANAIASYTGNGATTTGSISVTNGAFSSDPASFVPASGYQIHKFDNLYHVHATTGNTVVGASSATCTASGYSGNTVCAGCGMPVATGASIPALGHSWGAAVVTTPATETSEGVATSTCGRCGATQTSVLAKLPATNTDTTATDESGSKVDVTVTDNTPTTIPGTTTPAAGTVTYNGTEAAAGSAPTTTATVPSTVTIGGSTYVVTAIAEDAFKDEAALQSVTIPETVTTIGSSAFEGCSSLTSVSIPAGVTTIESSTFAGCTNLTTVEVKGEVTEIAADAFNGCTNLTGLTTSGGLKPLAAASAATGKLVLPASVTKVGDRAFKGTGITSVTIPAGVKMGTGVFRDCKQLKSASVEKSVKTLSSYTFKGCSALKSVTVPSGVTKIERSAFSGCKNLTKVTLPKTVTSIGKNALYGASKAKTLTINSKKLTKSGVKGSLAGSKVATVKVPKSMVSAYKKIFTAKNCGKKVTVKAIA